MSENSKALEAAVKRVIENRGDADGRQTARQRRDTDLAYADILKLIAPRIRFFTRQYGLVAHWEDAEQVCAIAVHRAIEAYDPSKAKFTTFVNWQLRGELQSLRFRLMADQRPSAQKVDAQTISIHTLTTVLDGEQVSLDAIIEDETALDLTESCGADHLAEAAATALLDAYFNNQRKAGMEQLRKRARMNRPKPEMRAQRPDLPVSFRAHAPVDKAEVKKLDERIERDREIVERWIFDTETQYELSEQMGITRERVRQITRNAAKGMAEIAATDPRFEMMKDIAERRLEPKKPAKKAKAGAEAASEPSLLPETASGAKVTDPTKNKVTSLPTALKPKSRVKAEGNRANELAA